jgi:hypothetical protein
VLGSQEPALQIVPAGLFSAPQRSHPEQSLFFHLQLGAAYDSHYRGPPSMSTPETPVYIIELNTISNPTSGIRDESRYRHCEACGSRLRCSNGLDRDPVCELLTDRPCTESRHGIVAAATSSSQNSLVLHRESVAEVPPLFVASLRGELDNNGSAVQGRTNQSGRVL